MLNLEHERRQMVIDAVGWVIPYEDVAAFVTRPAERGCLLLRLGQLYHFATGTGPFDWQFVPSNEGFFCLWHDFCVDIVTYLV